MLYCGRDEILALLYKTFALYSVCVVPATDPRPAGAPRVAADGPSPSRSTWLPQPAASTQPPQAGRPPPPAGTASQAAHLVRRQAGQYHISIAPRYLFIIQVPKICVISFVVCFIPLFFCLSVFVQIDTFHDRAIYVMETKDCSPPFTKKMFSWLTFERIISKKRA